MPIVLQASPRPFLILKNWENCQIARAALRALARSAPFVRGDDNCGRGEEKRRQCEARLGMSWRGKTGQARARQENTRQDQARQVKGKDGKKRRGKARAIQPDPEASYNSKH